MRGQDQDVDLGMAEEPEQVLPEQRLAAAGRLEEAGAESLIEELQDQAARENRHGRAACSIDVMNSAHVESGSRNQVRPGARMLIERGDVVHRAHERREAQRISEAVPTVCCPRCTPLYSGLTLSGAYAGPARHWRHRPRTNEAGQHQQTGRARPSRTDTMLSRGNAMSGAPICSGIRKFAHTPDKQRHDGEEHHDRAVHGDQRIVELRQHHATGRPWSRGTAGAGQRTRADWTATPAATAWPWQAARPRAGRTGS